MDMITATNSFRHPGKALALLIGIIALIWGGCGNKPKDISDFGKAKDVTEDIYHRLKAGMFEPSIDPLVCQIMAVPSVSNINALRHTKPPTKLKRTPRKIARVSWERGSFRVQSDDLGRVVIYMDEETLFSHVQVATLDGLGIGLQFFEIVSQPIR